MNAINADTYSEVYSFLGLLGYELISRMPEKEYNRIINEKNDEYNPKYKLDDFKDDEKMSKEARYLILSYHLKYWCDTQDEKEEIIRRLKENDERLSKQYDVFKNKKTKQSEQTNNQEFINTNGVDSNMQLVSIDKKGLLNKVLKIINEIIKKILNKTS